MGEHRHNPVALANSVPRQSVQALDLGGAAALLGIQLMPVLDETRENLVILVVAIGGRKSEVVPLEPRPVVISELLKTPVAGLVKAFLGGGGGGIVSAGTSPPDASAIEAKAAGLVVVP